MSDEISPQEQGRPQVVVVGPNGIAVGGGFELTLACHHRVAADNDKTRVGLPEIKVGLFPGAGGTQRVARLLPPSDALQFLLKCDQIPAARAKALKLVDAVVPAGELIKAAKQWIAAGGAATLEFAGRRVEVQAFPAGDPSIARASAEFLRKYRPSTHAQEMVRSEILSTTLRLEPR